MFALDGAKEHDTPCVYALGFSFVYDKFFRDSDAELSVTRFLSSMPIAKRAYHQEGFLVGSELELGKFTPKHNVPQRLLAKFGLAGDRHSWLQELSTFARRDVYSEVFLKIKTQVIRMVESYEKGGDSAPVSKNDRFSALR